jgi:hypothetical protein
MTQENIDYAFSFEVEKAPAEIFKILLDVRTWWAGLFGEDIHGSSEKINDEFTFSAGGGVHFSKQKLTALVPGKLIAWNVIQSNLTFLNKTDEWTDTRISFEIIPVDDKSKVVFTHHGLVPEIECYVSCSGAWTKYMEKLEKSLLRTF